MTLNDSAIAKQAKFFTRMDKTVADKILAGARPLALNRGEPVFVQGEPPRAIYLVIEGWLKLSRLSSNGTEAVFGVFTRGDTLGDPLPSSDMGHPVSCHAVTPGRVLEIRADALLARMRQDPDVAEALLSSAFDHVTNLFAQVETLVARNGAQRVAEFLVSLAPVREGACTLSLPYEKELVAGRLGLKPESLSRILRQLRAQGVVNTRASVRIEDVARLAEFADNRVR
ncbi:transcriptional regulator Dnr [Dinoroseobacter shibae DFL 12 = DSM 16493]|jgi:CRP-like cAMP-binding protein|uniref:Transcriptional regulator Dnr n=1 Tax=Dinoroseobacter shibae (strain DSM 16493 / NCIMB 14021 / DFL 12) TaxID=398580 RepID=A8LM15_DINSH|nr:Crp/Fnr family transcriptional regulator [Dinoroseobacter shibae]ABV94924.1 transcriptional regulator Dnr [Dinoroseobacter shibae DFL 12 = DSM 16493]URF46345.1 Crp/Fnr family transcriptional regulator [Dinoroseobacter shibae]URF50651.1 Crp/Fnr family transcriptional regulator [Dinoroseobacter shibae]